jgi:hypothetical protein
MLRKDIDSHEDAAMKQHNRLLLGKAKEQQHIVVQQQQINQEAQEEHDEVKQELKEVKGAHADLKRAHERLREAHDCVKHEVEELRGQVGYEIVLRVKHSVLTGKEPFVPRYPQFPTRVYSENKTVQGHRVRVYVQTKDKDPQFQDHYGVYLAVHGGHFPCKATCTLELVHYDGNPLSAVKKGVEYIFTEADSWGPPRFVHKARFAYPDNNPYVKDGFVTFKCTFNFVNE